MTSDNSHSVVMRQAARRSTVMWVAVSLPSVAIVVWLGKLKPGMPLWYWMLGVYAALQLSVAMVSVRRQWLRARSAAQSPEPAQPDSRRERAARS